MSRSLSVPGRFNGPLESGNGGYCAGLVAGLVDGPVEVSLRSPVPLDAQLDTAVGTDGTVRVSDGETLVAEAEPAEPLELDVPEPVSVEVAREAMASYRGLDDGPFCRCFVCGRAREDSFGVFAGEVEGRGLVASAWTPPALAADDRGEVRPEIVSAVLDCPTYFAAHIDDELTISYLVRFAVRIDVPVRAGREHVVVAWPIEIAGRKRRAGSAVMTAEGETLAIAEALLLQSRG
jgi:hypothetical protein